MTNAPSTSWYIVDVLKHNDMYTVQVAYSFASSTCPVYIRTQTNGTWNAWRLFNPGTANTAQVLTGYTFSSANGTNLSGTMANRGNLNWSGSNTTYSVPAGYYSGGTLDSRPSYNNGVNAGKNTYSMKSASGSVTWANPGTKTLTVSFTPIFFISYGTTSAGNIGLFAALKNFHQIMRWGSTVVVDSSSSSVNQIVFNSNSVAVTTNNSAFRGRTMTYWIYGT